MLLVWLWLGWMSIAAQGDAPYMVYIEKDKDQFGLDHLLFIHMQTGQSTRLDLYGERYTILGREVLYFDRQSNRMMLASPDGATRPHPFIPMPSDAYRIDWVVSGGWADGGMDNHHAHATGATCHRDFCG